MFNFNNLLKFDFRKAFNVVKFMMFCMHVLNKGLTKSLNCLTNMDTPLENILVYLDKSSISQHPTDN